MPGLGELTVWVVLLGRLFRREVRGVEEDEGGAVTLADQFLSQSFGDSLDDRVGQLVQVVEVGPRGEGGPIPLESPERAVRPRCHPVLGDWFVGATRDEGEERLGRGGAAGDLVDDAGEPELVVGSEERGASAEREGSDLDTAEDRLRVGEAADDLRLGTEVEVDGVDDVAVDAALLAEAEVGGPSPSDAVEEDGEWKWSLHINDVVGTADTNDGRPGS